MIRAEGLVKILDFGLSKLMQSAIRDSEQSSAVTVPGILLGTIDYMSPEQVRRIYLGRLTTGFPVGLRLAQAKVPAS